MSANVVADCDELNLPIMDRGSYELDVYGFGMVLYELMERRRPYYQHRTPLAVAQCILKGEVDTTARFWLKCDCYCVRLLSVDSDERATKCFFSSVLILFLVLRFLLA